MSYELLGHERFMEQFAQHQVGCSASGEDLIHELKVIQADPFANGTRTMHKIGDPDLVHKVLRRHVTGPEWYRLIFMVERESQIAMPVFVSQVPKAKFAYESAQWQGLGWLALCQEIAADYAADPPL